jgi:N-acetylglucosamine-6-sulfatase
LRGCNEENLSRFIADFRPRFEALAGGASRARDLPDIVPPMRIQRVSAGGVRYALAAAILVLATSVASPPTQSVTKPNIVFILTDDMTTAELADMPNVRSLIAARGTTFRHGYVLNPLCCPSRATILTGRTSGQTGIWDNTPPDGGFQAFRMRKEERSDLPVWLHDAGYHTGIVGKYLNGYTPEDTSYVAKGWDEWHVLALGTGGADAEGNGGYYDYMTSDDGRSSTHAAAQSDYSTTALGDDAVTFIDSAPTTQPLFLFFAPRAPHRPATPEAKYATAACPTSTAPRHASFNEGDVSDKPAYIRARPRVGRRNIDDLAARRCRTLLSVDDQVARIVRALKRTGRLRNTLLVFMSDNGYELRQHRWNGKTVPYEEALSVPIVARWDGRLPAGATDARLVTNQDIAVTFADAARTSAPGAGGLDFLKPARRKDFLVEHEGNGRTVPAYCGVHTSRFSYVLYNTGEEELYDLARDPWEVRNAADVPRYTSTRSRLRARALRLCVPRPPGWTQG